MSTSSDVDAIVLAGARSERLGGIDKALLQVGSTSLLQRAVEAVGGASRIVVVGPRREVSGDVRWCADEPAAGPVAAFAAGLAHIAAPVVVLLAIDLPFVAAAVPRLVEALAGHDAALLVDATGRTNYLAAAWSADAARRRLAALESTRGASMRALVAAADTVEVADPSGWSADCDTWPAVEAARLRASVEGI